MNKLKGKIENFGSDLEKIDEQIGQIKEDFIKNGGLIILKKGENYK